MSQAKILCGDVREQLRTLPAESVQCVVTSPPYWGLRDYGVDGQLGLEATPEEFVVNMVDVFREVRRVLRDDGTLWLNMGDSYVAAQGGRQSAVGELPASAVEKSPNPHKRHDVDTASWGARDVTAKIMPARDATSLKPKDLVGQPWRLAFALQADGWWLRSDIIWSKPNPMPESVTDRPTRAHEYVFLLTKRARYFYDADAIREKPTGRTDPITSFGRTLKRGERYELDGSKGRNRRTVWEIATAPFPEAHFATFPPALVEPCIMAGTPERGACAECGAPWERVVETTYTQGGSGGPTGFSGNAQGMTRAMPERKRRHDITTGWRPTCDHDAPTAPATVLDPFSGAATTGLVALQLGRRYIGIELNPEYVAMSRKRLAPLLAQPDFVNIAAAGGE